MWCVVSESHAANYNYVVPSCLVSDLQVSIIQDPFPLSQVLIQFYKINIVTS